MNRILASALCLALSSPALAAQVNDSLVVTGPNMQQIPLDRLLVTPTGGTQQTLARALSNAGGGTTFSQQATQAVSASAYGTGQAVGGLLTFNASARAPSYSGNAAAMTIALPDAQIPTLDVVIFNANPTTSTITNGQAVVISAADQAKQIGVFHVSDCTGSQTVCQTQQYALPFALAGTSTTLYAVVIARNVFTPSNLPVGSPAWLVTMLTQQN